MPSKSPIEFLHPVGDFALSISSLSTTAAAIPFKLELASSFVTTFTFETTSSSDTIFGAVVVVVAVPTCFACLQVAIAVVPDDTALAEPTVG